MKPQGGLGVQGLQDARTVCRDETVPEGEVAYVSSGDGFGVLILRVDGTLCIDGEVHVFGDEVKGLGTISGEGALVIH